MNKQIQTFREWEIQLGLIVEGATDSQLDQSLDHESFVKVAFANGVPRGVNHDERSKFLSDNGYEITRENMSNSDLSNRTTPEPDPGQVLVDHLKVMQQAQDQESVSGFPVMKTVEEQASEQEEPTQ